MLGALRRNAGTPMTREAIAADVQAQGGRIDLRMVDVHVLRLRLKSAPGGAPVVAEWGRGYVLVPSGDGAGTGAPRGAASPCVLVAQG